MANSKWKGRIRGANRFMGADMHYGERHTPGFMDKFGRSEAMASQWTNRRPICPYGCGQEGVLVEIIVEPGESKATGYYKDSEQLLFTAPMELRPKPSTRKIVRGPDGELHETTEEST